MVATKEIARKLPKGWRWVKLGEVCEIVAGQSPPGATYRNTPQGLPFFQGKSDFGMLYPVPSVWCVEPNKIAEKGDILISVRAPVGPTNVADMRCCIGRGLAAIRCSVEVSSEFILAGLRRFEQELVNKGSGSTFEAISRTDLENLEFPLPPFPEQKRIAAILNEQMSAVERARAAAEEQKDAVDHYPVTLVRESLKKHRCRKMTLGDCLDEERNGVGPEWSKYPVLGATRRGLALAKDPVGKIPQRYKLVTHGTIFYNPMRILLGSIAMVDESDTPGITSPDYVVMRGKDGILDSRWFYYWFRSPYGAHLIESLSRGAVRERILFNRLEEGMIEVPPIEVQREASEKMRHVAGVKELIDAQLDGINALPATLLRRAFAGEL